MTTFSWVTPSWKPSTLRLTGNLERSMEQSPLKELLRLMCWKSPRWQSLNSLQKLRLIRRNDSRQSSSLKSTTDMRRYSLRRNWNACHSTASTTMASSWNLMLPWQLTVACTPCPWKKTENWTSLSMKTSGFRGSSGQTPHMQAASSLSRRRMENYDRYKTTTNSTNGQSPANTHCCWLKTSSISLPVKNGSPSSMCDGVTTTNRSKRKTNGRLPSRQREVYLSLWWCSSDCATPPPPSKASWTTPSTLR